MFCWLGLKLFLKVDVFDVEFDLLVFFVCCLLELFDCWVDFLLFSWLGLKLLFNLLVEVFDVLFSWLLSFVGLNVVEFLDVCDEGWLLVWDFGLNIFILFFILFIIWLGLNDFIYWEVFEVLFFFFFLNIIELGLKVCFFVVEFV